MKCKTLLILVLSFQINGLELPPYEARYSYESDEINIEGISVNKEKYVIYLLFEDKPSLSISFLIDFFISLKINIKSKKSKKIFNINKYCKLSWFNSIKLRSINVKNVKKPINSVILDRIIMNIFFFKNSIMK